MSPLFTYLLKLSVCLSVVYLFYQLFLRRLTFYNWNRWYLLGYTLLAYLIPFINVNKVLDNSHPVTKEVVDFIPVVGFAAAGSVTEVRSTAWGYEEWVLVLIVTGVGVMLSRLLVQHYSFRKMKKESVLLLNDKVKLYQVDKNIIPFSFGNTIFVNQHQHSEEELREIIRHEFIHVKQKHTMDIIWSECLCILNWYNPFVWLIRFAIRQNLEFIADHKVLENGIDKKEYQYLLLKVVGVSHFSFASKFNFSSLKKRIAMMNSMKSARVHLIKFLFMLPLVAVLLVSFRDKLSKGPYVRYEGLVFDIQTHQPIANVTVTDQPTGKTAVSDKNGRYSFEFEKNAAKLDVFMVFRKDGYIKQEAAFFIKFDASGNSNAGLMEMVGMRQGHPGDNCKDCFSSISMKHEETPEQISESDFTNWLNERKQPNATAAEHDPYGDWKMQGVNFKADHVYVSEDNNFVKITGIKDFNYTEPHPKGVVIYKKKEYSLHDFAVEYGFLPFKTVYLFQGKTAFDRFGNKGQHGVMYVVDPVLNDTIPTPALAPKPSDAKPFPKGVRSIMINNHSAKVKLDNGKEELYDLEDAAQKATFIKKYGELPKAPAAPPPSPATGAPAAPNPSELTAPPAPPAELGTPIAPAPPPPPARPKKGELPSEAQWEKATGDKQLVNKQGYILSVADNNGECIVIVKNKSRKILTSMLLEDWNKNEKANTAKYGNIPPPPPPRNPASALPAPGADQGIITAPPAGYALQKSPRTYDPSNPSPQAVRLTNVNGNSHPLIIIDGIEQAENTSLNNLDKESIESITILKDAGSKANYGEKAKDGVILITTKGQKLSAVTSVTTPQAAKEKNLQASDLLIKVRGNFKGLYVIDGKQYSATEAEALHLDPSSIESINVLKGIKATEVYGEKGKEGVIVVTRK